MSEAKALRMERIEQYGLPPYSLGEEIFNSVSHGLGAAASVVGLVFLLPRARGRAAVAGAMIFAVSSILLYTVSSLYHGMHVSAAKKFMRVADHCSIYLMIGGCCTPLIFMILEGAVRTVLVLGVWATGILGITLNLINLKRFSKLSMACYFVMGLFLMGAIPLLIHGLGRGGVLLLVAGGLSYTVGAVLYGVGKKCKLPYVHTVFHFFVLAGTAAHYAMIYLYLL